MIALYRTQEVDLDCEQGVNDGVERGSRVNENIGIHLLVYSLFRFEVETPLGGE